MTYILDTNICIFWLNGNETVAQKINTLTSRALAITFITLSELYYGAFKSMYQEANLSKIDELLRVIQVIESNTDSSTRFGQLKAQLETEGKPLDDTDIFIGAVALTHRAILVTDNIKHFQRIEGLQLENWINPLRDAPK